MTGTLHLAVSWVDQHILSLTCWHCSSVDNFSEALLYIFILNSSEQLKTKQKAPATINIYLYTHLQNLKKLFLRAGCSEPSLPLAEAARLPLPLADWVENPCHPLKFQGFCWWHSSVGIDIQPQGCSLISSLPPQGGLFYSFSFRVQNQTVTSVFRSS